MVFSWGSIVTEIMSMICRDGIQLRKNAWQDGVAGTNCPIPPGQSWTYNFKIKDQIGSFYYYPSLLFQKAAGGFGSISVNPRRAIPTPFAPPAADFVVLIGDWYKTDHKVRHPSKPYPYNLSLQFIASLVPSLSTHHSWLVIMLMETARSQSCKPDEILDSFKSSLLLPNIMWHSMILTNCTTMLNQNYAICSSRFWGLSWTTVICWVRLMVFLSMAKDPLRPHSLSIKVRAPNLQCTDFVQATTEAHLRRNSSWNEEHSLSDPVQWIEDKLCEKSSNQRTVISDRLISFASSGKTYRLRISNVGLVQTLNFRIQGHRLLLVETEGSYVAQTYYSTLDVHVGQSYSVLVTMDQSIPADFHIVASSRFAWPTLYGLAVLHYSTSHRGLVPGDLPRAPNDVQSSYEQARSIRWALACQFPLQVLSFPQSSRLVFNLERLVWNIPLLVSVQACRWNLTAGAARPNPQGSYHYGWIKINKTYVFANSALKVKDKERFAVNGVSSLRSSTPLKLADYLKLDGVFHVGSIPDHPIDWATPSVASSVVAGDFQAFVEIVFQNPENHMQSWHIDGYAFFVVGCVKKT